MFVNCTFQNIKQKRRKQLAERYDRLLACLKPQPPTHPPAHPHLHTHTHTHTHARTHAYTLFVFILSPAHPARMPTLSGSRRQTKSSRHSRAAPLRAAEVL